MHVGKMTRILDACLWVERGILDTAYRRVSRTADSVGKVSRILDTTAGYRWCG